MLLVTRAASTKQVINFFLLYEQQVTAVNGGSAIIIATTVYNTRMRFTCRKKLCRFGGAIVLIQSFTCARNQTKCTYLTASNSFNGSVDSHLICRMEWQEFCRQVFNDTKMTA